MTLGDAENVIQTTKGSIIKRKGLENVDDAGVDKGAMVYHSEEDEILIAGQNLKKMVSDTISTVSADLFEFATANQPIDTVEYNGVMYFTKFNSWMKKYDGNVGYTAGMFPFSVDTNVSAGGSIPTANPYIWIQIYSEIIDRKGNVSQSDLADNGGLTIVSGGNQTVDIDVISSSNHNFFKKSNGWEYNYCTTNFNNIAVDLSESYDDVTLSIQNGPTNNIQVGDYVYVRTLLSGFPNLLAYEVQGVTSTTLTVRVYREDHLPESVIINTVNGTYISNMKSVIHAGAGGASDQLADISFYFQGEIGIRGYEGGDLFSTPLASFSLTSLNTDSANAFTSSLDFNGNVLPPVCQYCEVHDGVMYLANGSFSHGVASDETSTDRVIDANSAITLYNASLSSNNQIETFKDGEDSTIIGDLGEGQITALKSHNGYLLIFKKRSLYYQSGPLLSRRIDKVHGSQVGCVSHRSIQEIQGMIFFLSARGVYAVRGGQIPTEISVPIADKFLNDDLNLIYATSAHDFLNRQYILHIPSKTTTANDMTFVFDYYRQGWLVWKGINALGGALEYRDDIYFSDTSGPIYRFQDARNDDGAPISAFIEGHWEDLGEPSIPKKFVNLKVFNIDGSAHTSTIKSYIDFIDANEDTNRTITLESQVTPFDKIKLEAGKNKAHTMKFRIENNTLDEEMEITGYEIEYEAPFKKMKQ